MYKKHLKHGHSSEELIQGDKFLHILCFKCSHPCMKKSTQFKCCIAQKVCYSSDRTGSTIITRIQQEHVVPSNLGVGDIIGLVVDDGAIASVGGNGRKAQALVQFLLCTLQPECLGRLELVPLLLAGLDSLFQVLDKIHDGDRILDIGI